VIKNIILNLPYIRDRDFRQKVKWYIYRVKRLIRLNTQKNINSFSYSIEGYETFFGYYDISPISRDNTKILSHAVRSPAQSHTGKTTCDIGYFTASDGLFHKLDTITTWCWQMGARLRWSNDTQSIFYNTIINNQHGCVKINALSRVIEKKIIMPLYDISPDEKYGISINFSRLGRLRVGYGYLDITDESQDQLAPNNDGIFIIDLDNNTKKMLISLHELSQKCPEDTMLASEHYINHVCISPNSKTIMFFHLWKPVSGSHHTRLMSIEPDGSNLKVLSTKGKPSHYCWLNDSDYLVTMC